MPGDLRERLQVARLQLRQRQPDRRRLERRVTRRRALSQVVGFLLLDNGITATAFLATSGLPLIVELGVSIDLLLVVLVLQVLTSRLRTTFGSTDLDELQELHDQ